MKKLLSLSVIVALFILLFSHLVYATKTEPIPTGIQIEETWTPVNSVNGRCGTWAFFTNPNTASRYSVAYIHRCTYFNGEISQYGILDNDKLREFNYEELNAPPIEIFRSVPSLEKMLRKYSAKPPKE